MKNKHLIHKCCSYRESQELIYHTNWIEILSW